jgi:hypothetical protein
MQINKKERQSVVRSPQGTSNTDNCAAGGREDKDDLDTFRKRNIATRTDNNEDSRGTNIQSCAGEGKRKGTSREVPQLGKGCTQSVHHLSGLGKATCQCWGPIGCMTVLGRKSILGAGLFLGERSILGTRPFLERKTYFWSTCNKWKENKTQKKKEKEHAVGKTMWRACRHAKLCQG